MTLPGPRRSRRFNIERRGVIERRSGINAALRFWLFLTAVVFSVCGAESAADFEAGNRLYEKGDYAGAIGIYQKLANQDAVSPALLFNLGNAYFKNGQPGKAIMAYRQAQALAPRDPDIRANLHFARSSVPGNNLRLTILDRLLQTLSLNELGTITAAAFWLWFGLLALAQWKPAWKTPLRIYVVAAGIFVVFITAWLAKALLDRATNQAAVVTVPTSAVRFGPLEESQISFNVRDGNELRVLGQKGAWLQVSDPSERAGWILTNDVTRLH